MAWLNGWGRRIKLTIDQNDIDDALANFPILVYLSTSSGRNNDDVSCVFDELQNNANRKKIAVTTSDGETQCYVEIEKWDDANEQAWLWVKVPSVASGADTDLYLYYDKTKADNTTYVGDPNSTPAENVWDANFKFVCHMRDDPDTSHVRDSTSNHNHGTKKGAGEPAEVAGQIDDAQDFDGDDDVINCGKDASLNSVGAITIEAWIKPDIGYSPDDIAGVCNKWNARLQIYIASASGVGTWRIKVGGADKDVSFGIIPENSWSYTVGTYVTGSQITYLDGNLINEAAPVGNLDDHSASDLEVGRYAGGRHHGGLIDEFRVSNISRTAPWIKASYESERDHLLDFGSEEEAANISLENKSANMGSKMVAAGLI